MERIEGSDPNGNSYITSPDVEAKSEVSRGLQAMVIVLTILLLLTGTGLLIVNTERKNAEKKVSELQAENFSLEEELLDKKEVQQEQESAAAIDAVFDAANSESADADDPFADGDDPVYQMEEPAMGEPASASVPETPVSDSEAEGTEYEDPFADPVAPAPELENSAADPFDPANVDDPLED